MADSAISQPLPVVTRAEARSRGATRYRTGAPCKYGHLAERLTSNCVCVRCAAICDRAHREIKYAATQRWRLRNKNLLRDKQRAYDAMRDPAKVSRRVSRWAKANRDKHQANKNLRRARQNGASGVYTEADVAALIVKQGGLCISVLFGLSRPRCARDITGGDRTVDHKMPLSRGGSNWPRNLQLACKSCNCSKGTKTNAEWIAAQTA